MSRDVKLMKAVEKLIDTIMKLHDDCRGRDCPIKRDALSIQPSPPSTRKGSRMSHHRVEEWADEVFLLVEKDQGFGFVSEGMGILKSEKDFLSKIKAMQYHTELAGKKLKKWIRKTEKENPDVR